jgi:hypothetical protein
MSVDEGIGKRIVKLDGVLDVFEAQEGEVQHIIGKTGMGKTYEATRRALGYLYSGYTVYTTWHLNLPEKYDERDHFWPVVRNFFMGRNRFFSFDLKNNWKHIDIDRPDLVDFLASLTDCIVMLDEGQDVFDSHDRASKAARKTITRTRHMHKTLIIISQRAQAVDVNARGNVTYFYRCEKMFGGLLPALFKVYRTDEIDDSSNYPIWVRHDSTGRIVWHAEVWHKAWARKSIYDSYDSWYLRQSMIRSQVMKLDAFETTFFQRFRLFLRVLNPRKRTKGVSSSETAPVRAFKIPKLPVGVKPELLPDIPAHVHRQPKRPERGVLDLRDVKEVVYL